MTVHEIQALIVRDHGEAAVVQADTEVMQPWLEIAADSFHAVCQTLRDHPETYFDYLECLSGVDLGPEEDRIGVVYHLMSIPRGHRIVLKCFVSRTVEKEGDLPTLPSIADIWKTADWHEREAYDLLGIHFAGHPDLRRILMPEDWEGHPLRKDYVNPDFYHGIKTEY